MTWPNHVVVITVQRLADKETIKIDLALAVKGGKGMF